MPRSHNRAWTLAAALLLTAAAASDAGAELVTRSWSEQTEGCGLTLEEYSGGSYGLRLRTPEAPMAAGCSVPLPVVAEGLSRLFRQAAPAGDVSLSLGRVVEIPTLSADLVQAARSSAAWDPGAGRPRRGDPNAFVESLLRRSAALRELLPGFEVVGVSVEKVLVPTKKAVRERKPGDGIPDARLPYDAQLWVRLRPKP